ncbi:MAG: hypothetical protein ACJ8CR_24630 [Roseiflexaceae bacterium]
MLNRILYWFITLPMLGKAGCLTTLVIVFACSGITVASIPAARARQVAQATQTAVAEQAQSTQVAMNNTATSVANTTATAQTNQAAIATSAAAAQNATSTSEIVAQGATQTAIVAPTMTAQAALDATNATIAAATANANETSVAVIESTAVAVKTAEALATAQTATAVATGLLPALQAADIKVNLQNRDFTCTTAEKGELYYSWTCTRETSLYLFRVDFYGRTLRTIDYVDATALQFIAEPTDELVAPFLGFLATLPYDGADPQTARGWVEQTLPTLKGKGDVREKTFGGVLFRLFGIPTARTLTMGNLP